LETDIPTLPVENQEGFDDLVLRPDWYEGAVLWSTDWTAETIIGQLKKGAINLNPRYQRRNAWDRGRKSRFIESLILGLPVPQLILAEDNTKRGSFIVIDGKQRLLTLRQAAADELDDFDKLFLWGLDDRRDLNGLDYERLKNNIQFSDDARSFENQPIRTVVIRNWKDEQYLYSVFLRINTGSVQLSPQELRQALHPGPFTDYIDDFSTESQILQRAMGIQEPDFRMRDVELVLRFFAYRFFIGSYDGNLKRFLDRTVSRLNERWSDGASDLKSEGIRLNVALETTFNVFGANHLRKWNGVAFERPINRAVFDIMTYFFADQRFDIVAHEKKVEIVEIFKRLCTDNREFIASLETTTKSVQANRTRFNTWADALSSITGLDVPHPIEDNVR
jgi:hypothetical protein